MIAEFRYRLSIYSGNISRLAKRLITTACRTQPAAVSLCACQLRMGRRTRVATCFLAGISRGGVLMMDRFKFRRRLCLGMTGLLIGSGLIAAAGAHPANPATRDLVPSAPSTHHST